MTRIPSRANTNNCALCRRTASTTLKIWTNFPCLQAGASSTPVRLRKSAEEILCPQLTQQEPDLRICCPESRVFRTRLSLAFNGSIGLITPVTRTTLLLKNRAYYFLRHKNCQKGRGGGSSTLSVDKSLRLNFQKGFHYCLRFMMDKNKP